MNTLYKIHGLNYLVLDSNAMKGTPNSHKELVLLDIATQQRKSLQFFTDSFSFKGSMYLLIKQGKGKTLRVRALVKLQLFGFKERLVPIKGVKVKENYMTCSKSSNSYTSSLDCILRWM